MTTPIDTSTSEGFKAAREELGLSKPELGAILRVQERTLSRWESGKPPHPSAAVMLDRMLFKGVRPLSWPLCWTGEEMALVRKKAELTQDQMALALDIETDTYAAYERGDGPPEFVAEAMHWLTGEWAIQYIRTVRKDRENNDGR